MPYVPCINCGKKRACLLFQSYTPDMDGYEVANSVQICRKCLAGNDPRPGHDRWVIAATLLDHLMLNVTKRRASKADDRAAAKQLAADAYGEIEG